MERERATRAYVGAFSGGCSRGTFLRVCNSSTVREKAPEMVENSLMPAAQVGEKVSATTERGTGRRAFVG